MDFLEDRDEDTLSFCLETLKEDCSCAAPSIHVQSPSAHSSVSTPPSERCDDKPMFLHALTNLCCRRDDKPKLLHACMHAYTYIHTSTHTYIPVEFKVVLKSPASLWITMIAFGRRFQVRWHLCYWFGFRQKTHAIGSSPKLAVKVTPAGDPDQAGVL